MLDPAQIDPSGLVVEVELETDVPSDQASRIEAAATAVRQLGFSRTRALAFIGEPDPAFVLEEARREELADLEHELRMRRVVRSG